MTGLTEKHKTLARAIVLAGIPTHGTRLRGIVSVHFDRHTLLQRGFVGDHPLQFSKGPLRVSSVGLTLFLVAFLPFLRFVRSRMSVRFSSPMRA